MSSLNVVFMGSPAPVLPTLEAVHRVCRSNGWSLVAAYAAPDRPSGRGRRGTPSPVSIRAAELGIPVLTPGRVTSEEEIGRFRELRPDLVVLAAYGFLLPAPFLFEPGHGAVNVHPSLLPRHRGAAPIAGAIVAGDDMTGTTLIVMDEGLDTGAILAQETVRLHGDERAPELTNRLFEIGARMLEDTLPQYIRGRIEAIPQRVDGGTLIKRMTKADGVINWEEPAHLIERKVRAFDPWPGVATTWHGQRLALRATEGAPSKSGLLPGLVCVTQGDVVVGTGAGSLRLLRVQIEGRPSAEIGEFLRGHAAFTGAKLPS